MRQFQVPPPFDRLTGPYAPKDEFLNAAREGGRQARIGLARLWLSEGIPYAFRDCPALYETMRTWLSNKLGVHAKEISMVGSARIGYSLSPNKNWKQFDKDSDFDMFCVSEKQFSMLQDDFLQWASDYNSGKVSPRNDTEAGYWTENYSRVSLNLNKGFIDSTKVPNLPSYINIRKVNQTMYELVSSLENTDGAPKIRKASLRCYLSWDAFVNQASLNLFYICNK